MECTVWEKNTTTYIKGPTFVTWWQNMLAAQDSKTVYIRPYYEKCLLLYDQFALHISDVKPNNTA